MIEQRKQEERNFHNLVRDEALIKDPDRHAYYTSNYKYYAIDRTSKMFFKDWMAKNVPGKKVLDYCCGRGGNSLNILRLGAAHVTGIDISDTSIQLARKDAARQFDERRYDFQIMDAENLGFADGTFDVVFEVGALHHLNLPKAYAEIARVLKPGGVAICREALKHNPVFQLYRRVTPQLRTKWETEHILGKKEIELAKTYFRKVETLGFFHLSSLLAVPLRRSKLFEPLLKLLERCDDVLLQLPWVKWQAWKAVFLLSDPIKSGIPDEDCSRP